MIWKPNVTVAAVIERGDPISALPFGIDLIRPGSIRSTGVQKCWTERRFLSRPSLPVGAAHRCHPLPAPAAPAILRQEPLAGEFGAVTQAQGVDHSANWRVLLYDRLWPVSDHRAKGANDRLLPVASPEAVVLTLSISGGAQRRPLHAVVQVSRCAAGKIPHRCSLV